MRYKKVVTLVIAIAFIGSINSLAIAATMIYPEVYKYTGNISCPTAYPIKTGETSGGVYYTSCWSELAWSFYMAGGDEWTAWVNGTYIAPEPEPVPTPEPEVIVVTNTVVRTVVEPCVLAQPPTTRKQIRREIKKLQKTLKLITKKSSRR